MCFLLVCFATTHPTMHREAGTMNSSLLLVLTNSFKTRIILRMRFELVVMKMWIFSITIIVECDDSVHILVWHWILIYGNKAGEQKTEDNWGKKTIHYSHHGIISRITVLQHYKYALPTHSHKSVMHLLPGFTGASVVTSAMSSSRIISLPSISWSTVVRMTHPLSGLLRGSSVINSFISTKNIAPFHDSIPLVQNMQ